MTGLPNGASAPSETSPLLRSTDPEPVNGNGNGAIQSGGAGRADKRDGNPEMAKKMHLLLPAIGIGVGLTSAPQSPARLACSPGIYPDLPLRRGPASHRSHIRQDRQ